MGANLIICQDKLLCATATAANLAKQAAPRLSASSWQKAATDLGTAFVSFWNPKKQFLLLMFLSAGIFES